MVMSAVSSVSTPGVLVTVMPRSMAAPMAMLSTPLPKLAMSLRLGPASRMRSASSRSVTVGTSTSAVCIASVSWARVIATSSMFRRVSNSSHIRVSMRSGSRRVTMTRGFFLAMDPRFPRRSAARPPSWPPRLDAAEPWPDCPLHERPPYQMVT